MTTPEHRAPEGGRPVSEMQTRIARAIYEQMSLGFGKQWGQVTESAKGKYREFALAAMKAMREPTETMMTAAAKASDAVIQNGELWPGRDSAGLVLSAAFDAEISLAEGGKDA